MLPVLTRSMSAYSNSTNVDDSLQLLVNLKTIFILWQSTGSLGELHLSLSYSPATEKLRVSVLRARNLKKLEYGEDTG